MIFVWAGDRNEKNSTLNFTYRAHGKAEYIDVCGADYYRVFRDGKFVSFGPTRTAAGYANVRRIPVTGADTVTVQVQAYNVACYSCDRQLPYFGAEVYGGDGIIMATTLDFECVPDTQRRRDVPRYSYQRGFTEVYDLGAKAGKAIIPYEVEAPTLLGYAEDCSDYTALSPVKKGSGTFRGFDGVGDIFWKDNPLYAVTKGSFDIFGDFLDKVTDGSFVADDYDFGREVTGFIALDTYAKDAGEIFVCFEEILPDGKWIFRRTTSNDVVCVKTGKGRSEFLSAEPYAFRHMKIIHGGKADISPSVVLLQNDRANCVTAEGNEKIAKVFRAAAETFRQNAVDLYTDCPGRERAGWLCDSYFTASAERLFCGDSKIEKRFLKNFLLADTKEIPADMLPQCFPAEHPDGSFIPNWAMWFVLELSEYYKNTSDGETVAAAKDKTERLLRYFSRFENEYGLLENLQGWVFLEWSVSNTPEYVCGTNFPSNMLYALMLDKAATLYGDSSLTEKAAKIREKILALSYDGKFFADNAVRTDGKLCRCDSHVSETCQYYALFTGLCPDEAFARRMAEEFGPMRGDAYPEIGRSNMFIGNYLRFYWLMSVGERERVLRECIDYFGVMADVTGTLWENDTPTASCNHGFASVAAVLLLQALVGYRGVKDGKPVLDPSVATGKKYGVTVTFDYGKGKTSVEA